MRAIRVDRHGGPEVLTLAEVPEPEPGPNQLLVDVDAVGVNYIDTYFRTGTYPRPVPYIPGSEGTGIVAEIGSEVTGFAAGDRIAWAAGPNSYAPRTVVDAAVAVAVPGDVDPPVAASALLQGMTAHYL
ncbi:alcohol dehydrogenase catalytic domain-containing protein, partial [Nocardia sp. NPDC003345]